MRTYNEQVVIKVRQRVDYIRNANEHTYIHHLREFYNFCMTTPALQHALAQLPQSQYEWAKQWHKVEWPIIDDRRYAFQWSAITQLANTRDPDASNLLMRIGSDILHSQSTFTQEIITPLSDYLINSLETSSTMLYLLWRYKLWAEWFEAERLRKIYRDGGERNLDSDLRRFLFESGIDYPFSQPRSPGGQADVVANLETDDPLILEIKVWDSEKRYKENRVRDGLRQVVDYTDKYGKDIGYVVVFNIDSIPLEFIGETNNRVKPARIERNHTYYFISVNIAEQEPPISQKDKGKPVIVHEIQLNELWDSSAA